MTLTPEAPRLADALCARVVDATPGSFVFELTGGTDKLDAFLDLMRPLGLAEVSRSKVAAIARGKPLQQASVRSKLAIDISTPSTMRIFRYR